MSVSDKLYVPYTMQSLAGTLLTYSLYKVQSVGLISTLLRVHQSTVKKRWRLYIVPQYFANQTNPTGREERYGFTAVVPILTALSSLNDLLCEHEQWSIFSCEQRALHKFPATWNLSLLKRCFVPSNLADMHLQNRTTGTKLGNMISHYRGSTIPSSLQQIMPCLICRLLKIYFT